MLAGEKAIGEMGTWPSWLGVGYLTRKSGRTHVYPGKVASWLWLGGSLRKQELSGLWLNECQAYLGQNHGRIILSMHLKHPVFCVN